MKRSRCHSCRVRVRRGGKVSGAGNVAEYLRPAGVYATRFTTNRRRCQQRERRPVARPEPNQQRSGESRRRQRGRQYGHMRGVDR